MRGSTTTEINEYWKTGTCVGGFQSESKLYNFASNSGVCSCKNVALNSCFVRKGLIGNRTNAFQRWLVSNAPVYYVQSRKYAPPIKYIIFDNIQFKNKWECSSAWGCGLACFVVTWQVFDCTKIRSITEKEVTCKLKQDNKQREKDRNRERTWKRSHNRSAH